MTSSGSGAGGRRQEKGAGLEEAALGVFLNGHHPVSV